MVHPKASFCLCCLGPRKLQLSVPLQTSPQLAPLLALTRVGHRLRVTAHTCSQNLDSLGLNDGSATCCRPWVHSLPGASVFLPVGWGSSGMAWALCAVQPRVPSR